MAPDFLKPSGRMAAMCSCLIEHMDRLHTALTEYRITMPYDETEILAAVRKLR